MTAVGFEPTQLALVELESTPLDHSGKLSIVAAPAPPPSRRGRCGQRQSQRVARRCGRGARMRGLPCPWEALAALRPTPWSLRSDV